MTVCAPPRVLRTFLAWALGMFWNPLMNKRDVSVGVLVALRLRSTGGLVVGPGSLLIVALIVATVFLKFAG